MNLLVFFAVVVSGAAAICLGRQSSDTWVRSYWFAVLLAALLWSLVIE